MNQELIIDRYDDGVTVITFNRPDAHNALSLAAMRQFHTLVTDLHMTADLRVVVLVGAGSEAFCSGADIAELSDYPTAEDGLMVSQVMGDTLLSLERLPVPVIAAINGYALGGGSEIALACDMRVVDEKVRLGLVHVRLAVTPSWGAGQRLLRLVGYAQAMEILLRGRAMHAHELEALGLVNQIVAAGTALEHALSFARHIAQLPPLVVHSIKHLLQAGIQQPYDQALQAERALFPPLWADEPHIEAVTAFIKNGRHRK